MNLPIKIKGVYEPEDFRMNDDAAEKVKDFYKKLGFSNIRFIFVNPSLGIARDEIEADLPEGWTTEPDGHYWIDFFNGTERMLSVFCKKAPWDYDYFARR